MKILIDMSFVRPYELTMSIPIYGLRLLQAIPESRVKDVHLLIDGNLEHFFHEHFPQFGTTSVSVKGIFRKANWRVKDMLFDIVHRWKIFTTGFDIVLTLNELTSYATFRTRKKKVSVIHDLKDLSIKSGKKQVQSRQFYQRLIDRADIVVAISEYTRQNILNNYDVDAGKIRVIHNSIKMTAASKCPEGFSADAPYILYVNTLLEYKNPLTLLKAFKSVMDKVEERLVLVGRDTEYWHDVLRPYIKQNGLENRVTRMQNLTDEEIKYLYEHASLFVSSSRHEGFGYTPLEAAICCCPVICTKCEALPETTMMLLNYYEPAEDDSELANRIVEVLATPRNMTELKSISNRFIQEYSPERQVSQFFELMDNLGTETK